MARTPSLTTAQAESALGPRGSLQVNSENRLLVRKWLVSQGFPYLFVGGLSLKELALAYNGTDGEMINKLRAKLAETLNAEDVEDVKEYEGHVADGINVPVDDIGEYKAEKLAMAMADGKEAKAKALLDLLGDLVEAKDATLDEKRVREIADERIAHKLNGNTYRLEIKHRTGNITSIEGTFHPQFAELAQLAIAFGNDGYVPGIFVSGEASSGKTHGCRQLAKALGLDFHFNGAISMPHEMLGFIDGNGNYHRTPFREAYEHGGVYLFDEVDRCDPVALLAVNPHLANGVATFPDRQVTRHPNCIIIATGNTWGTGATAKYAGATKLDAAFLSRFPQRLAWNIDLDMEVSISGNEAWARRVQKARAKAQAAGLHVMIDVRMTLAGAAQIAAGATPDKAAARTYLANLTPEQRAMVEG